MVLVLGDGRAVGSEGRVSFLVALASFADRAVARGESFCRPSLPPLPFGSADSRPSSFISQDDINGYMRLMRH